MSVSQPLFSRVLGDGGHQVFALHCTMAHSGAWRGLAEVFAGDIAFQATDMFNHGKSPDWDGEGEFQLRMAEAAFATFDGPMDVIGHSFGATVALRMAAMRPEMVRRLVIIESLKDGLEQHENMKRLSNTRPRRKSRNFCKQSDHLKL